MNRILLVDDDAVLLETLRQALEDEFRVSTAVSAEDAFAQLALHSPDAMVLDESMPGLTGTGLLALLDPDAAPPTVLLSATADVRLARRALSLGADDLMTKPCDIEKLKSRLRLASGRRRAPGKGERPLALRGAHAGRKAKAAGGTLSQQTRRFGRAVIAEAVAECRGDRALAARRLQVSVQELNALESGFSSETAQGPDFSL